jgi:hypothetical protein
MIGSSTLLAATPAAGVLSNMENDPVLNNIREGDYCGRAHRELREVLRLSATAFATQ